MERQPITICRGGELSLSPQRPGSGPMLVHQDTQLHVLESQLYECQYILATDDAGAIAGVIETEQILQRLNASNFHERQRWSETPIRALIGSLLSSGTSDSAVPIRPLTECTAIVEDGKLFGLIVDDDMYLSWSRLEPLLSGGITDPLTGLTNRIGYERRLAEEWRRAQRRDTSIGVLVVDLDNFKAINDGHGHQAGDMVLRHVARILDDELRSYDLVARYGGDEFVAICLGCRVGEIEIPIRRVLTALTDRPVLWKDQTFQVSASVGAAVRHSGFTECDPLNLFSAADDCLYRAKETRGAAFRVEFDGSKHSTFEPILWRNPQTRDAGDGGVQRQVSSVVE